jgi:protein-disulfide isomerase-like protein with CxxC motif
VKETLGDEIDIQWKCFSLEQDHSTKGEDFKLWDHPEIASRSLKALQAAKCAQTQGNLLFDPFHLLLYEAFHKNKRDTTRDDVLQEIAQEARLDVQRFMEDLSSAASRQWVGEDHREAVEKYQAFGVPTLVFEEKWPFFLKLGTLPDSAEENVTFFKEIKEAIVGRPYLLEMKRT